MLFSELVFRSASPVGVADGSGGVHVLWSAPDSLRLAADTAASPDPLPGAVYYRHYRDGAWSAPEQIYRDSILVRWANGAVAALTDAAGRLHVMFSAGAGRHSRIVYLRRDSAGWRRLRMNSEAGAISGAYPTLTISPQGRLVVGFIDTALAYKERRKDAQGRFEFKRDYDNNSVLATTSDDNGQTWTKPLVVSRSYRHPAVQPQLVQTGKTTHLLWLKALREGVTSTEVVWHSRSTDGGRTWAEPLEVGTSLKGGFIGHAGVVADSCGNLHMVFRRADAFGGRNPRLYYARYDGAAWSEPEEVFPGMYEYLRICELAITRDGTLHLVAGLTDSPRRLPDLIHATKKLR